MSNIKLSFGYYVERPYGDWALTEKGSDFRKRKIDFERQLFGALDKEKVPRTLFILGEFLEKCLADFSSQELREVYNTKNELNDIGSHAYSHLLLRENPVQPHLYPVSAKEFGESIAKGRMSIQSILGTLPIGLGSPYGYHKDLSDMPEILESLDHFGFIYVSSNLQSENSVETKLMPERQPHSYENVGYPLIVEIPSHGWQDIIFTKEKVKKYFLERVNTSEEIIEHYTGLFEIAKSIAVEDKSTYISLCLHPWAVMDYDPNLEIHKRIIDSARKENIEIISYKKVAEEILNNKS